MALALLQPLAPDQSLLTLHVCCLPVPPTYPVLPADELLRTKEHEPLPPVVIEGSEPRLLKGGGSPLAYAMAAAGLGLAVALWLWLVFIFL